MVIIESMYDKPNINIKRRIIGIGNKSIDIFGIKWNTGINPKKTATSTNDSKPMEAVATTGKNSFLNFRDLIIPAFPVKLPRLPEVPLTNT